MDKVPGELTITGSFISKEVDFAVWVARNGLDGTVLKPNLAIVSCTPGRENEICQTLDSNKPDFVNSISQTKILWAKK